MGLTDRGHLGIGAKADVSIYDIDVNDFDTTLMSNAEIIEKKLLNALYTIKDGEIVVKDGQITNLVKSKHLWCNVVGLEEEEEQLIRKIKPTFNKYYTIKYENYGVTNHYIKPDTRFDINCNKQG